MKVIKLTQGKFAIVDDEDFEFLNQWKWYFDNRGYAVRKPKSGLIQMHILINKTPKGLFTDHINRNPLDNRRINLRTVTKQQNQANHKIFVTNTSGISGVRWNKIKKRWTAVISYFDKTIWLGQYKELQTAILAREQAERKYHAI